MDSDEYDTYKDLNQKAEELVMKNARRTYEEEEGFEEDENYEQEGDEEKNQEYYEEDQADQYEENENEFNNGEQLDLEEDFHARVNKMSEEVERKIRIDYENPEARGQNDKDGNIEDEKALDKQILELEMMCDEQDKIQKIQLLKIEALLSEIETSKKRLKEKDFQIADKESKGKQMSEEAKKHVAQVNTLLAKTDETKSELAKNHQKIEYFEKDNGNLGRDIEMLRRNMKKVEAELNKKDLKINRNQEEIDQFKVKMQENKHSNSEKNEDVRSLNQRLVQDNKKLEKQKREILQMFKKQLRLIDLLKRQRTHLEAGQMFQYSEAQFTKALDLGGKI